MEQILEPISDVLARHIEVMLDQKSLTNENILMIHELGQHMLPTHLQGQLLPVIGTIESPEGYKLVVGWRQGMFFPLQGERW